MKSTRVDEVDICYGIDEDDFQLTLLMLLTSLTLLTRDHYTPDLLVLIYGGLDEYDHYFLPSPLLLGPGEDRYSSI